MPVPLDILVIDTVPPLFVASDEEAADTLRRFDRAGDADGAIAVCRALAAARRWRPVHGLLEKVGGRFLPHRQGDLGDYRLPHDHALRGRGRLVLELCRQLAGLTRCPACELDLDPGGSAGCQLCRGDRAPNPLRDYVLTTRLLWPRAIGALVGFWDGRYGEGWGLAFWRLGTTGQAPAGSKRRTAFIRDDDARTIGLECPELPRVEVLDAACQDWDWVAS